MRLSLAMIVKDEARRLPDCLISVKGLVDEVVVVDTGSTDETRDIALKRGAKVLDFPWKGDFAAARNASLTACTGDWILVMDADETVDAADHAQIRTALEAPQISAYRVHIRNYMRSGAYMGGRRALQRNDGRYEEGSEYSHMDVTEHLRLFRSQKEPVFSGRVHELADPYFEAKGLVIDDLDVAIHHFGKVDVEVDAAKQAEYLRLAKEELFSRPEDLNAHWNVLQEALMVEAWDDALASAETIMRKVPTAPPFVCLGAARALLAQGRAGEAADRARDVLATEPTHAPGLTLLAQALHALGRKGDAHMVFGQAMEADPAYTLSFIEASRALLAEGDLELARQVLEAGLDQNPHDERLWEALVAHAARHAPERVAADAWDALQAVPDGGKSIWHQIVIHALVAQHDTAAARHVFERGLEAFPNHAELTALGVRCGLGDR